MRCPAGRDAYSDYLAVAVLRHGNGNGVVYGTDFGTDFGTCINRLTEPLKKCQSLAGKTKLFFIQVSLYILFNVLLFIVI